MELGVVFPQTEIGNDPSVIRDYAQAAEQLGYHHLLAYDHVVGAHPDRLRGTRAPYTHLTSFHEPFVLFGYLAGLTSRLELVSGVLILPQRQTALVAKQAAEVDLLSGGRLRLGVGSGWNPVEYEVLGQDFKRRGARLEEQVALLRRLWSEELVEFQGRFDTVNQAALLPRPTRRIPIWMGGTADAVLRRIARRGDGWFPQAGPGPELADQLQRLRAYVEAAGRPTDAVGVEGRLSIAQTPASEWASTAQQWRELGAAYLGVNTMGAGLQSPREHIAAIRRFKEAVG